MAEKEAPSSEGGRDDVAASGRRNRAPPTLYGYDLAYFGYLAAGVGLGFIFLATLIDPQFSWQSTSLSSMGSYEGSRLVSVDHLLTPDWLVFNSGLILGGVLGMPFLYRLRQETETTAGRAGIVLFAITLVGMSGVGVAYLDGPLNALHFPMALLFFAGLTFTMWVYGSGLVLRGLPREGVWTMWLANVHAFVWIVWIVLEGMVFTGDGDTWTYFAVPEYIGALLFGAWVAFQARRLLVQEGRGGTFG